MPILSVFAKFFNDFFGWSSYLLALGLIAFSAVHMAEDIQKKRLIRWSLVIGLLVLWLIVLAESRLIGGPKVGGVVATLLVIPLAGWPPSVIQVILIGLFIIVSIMAFRITFGHVLLVGRAMKKQITDGQRPHYSRYTANKSTSIPSSPDASSSRVERMPFDEDDGLDGA